MEQLLGSLPEVGDQESVPEGILKVRETMTTTHKTGKMNLKPLMENSAEGTEEDIRVERQTPSTDQICLLGEQGISRNGVLLEVSNENKIGSNTTLKGLDSNQQHPEVEDDDFPDFRKPLTGDDSNEILPLENETHTLTDTKRRPGIDTTSNKTENIHNIALIETKTTNEQHTKIDRFPNLAKTFNPDIDVSNDSHVEKVELSIADNEFNKQNTEKTKDPIDAIFKENGSKNQHHHEQHFAEAKSKGHDSGLLGSLQGNSTLHDLVSDGYRGDVVLAEFLGTEEGKHSINKQNKAGCTALHLACSRAYFMGIDLLIRNGADIDMTDLTRQTPLFYCLQEAKFACDTVKHLHRVHKADVLLKDLHGNTVLHSAILKGRSDCVSTICHAILQEVEDNLLGDRIVEIMSNANLETPFHLVASSDTSGQMMNSIVEVFEARRRLNWATTLSEQLDNNGCTVYERALSLGNSAAYDALSTRLIKSRNDFDSLEAHGLSLDSQLNNLNLGSENDPNHNSNPLLRNLKVQLMKESQRSKAFDIERVRVVRELAEVKRQLSTQDAQHNAELKRLSQEFASLAESHRNLLDESQQNKYVLLNKVKSLEAEVQILTSQLTESRQLRVLAEEKSKSAAREAFEADQRALIAHSKLESLATHQTVDSPHNGSWQLYQDDEGRAYYYNHGTGESSWELPPSLSRLGTGTMIRQEHCQEEQLVDDSENQKISNSSGDLISKNSGEEGALAAETQKLMYTQNPSTQVEETNAKTLQRVRRADSELHQREMSKRQSRVWSKFLENAGKRFESRLGGAADDLQLLRAVERVDVEAVRDYLHTGEPASSFIGQHGSTLLHVCSSTPVPWASGAKTANVTDESGELSRVLEIARLLEGAGCDVDAVDDLQATPLHHAAAVGNVLLVEFLLQCAASVNMLDTNQESPLHVVAGTCSHGGHLRCAELLIQYGASKVQLNCDGQTAHQVALETMEDASRLLKTGDAQVLVIRQLVLLLDDDSNGKQPRNISLANLSDPFGVPMPPSPPTAPCCDGTEQNPFRVPHGVRLDSSLRYVEPNVCFEEPNKNKEHQDGWWSTISSTVRNFVSTGQQGEETGTVKELENTEKGNWTDSAEEKWVVERSLNTNDSDHGSNRSVDDCDEQEESISSSDDYEEDSVSSGDDDDVSASDLEDAVSN